MQKRMPTIADEVRGFIVENFQVDDLRDNDSFLERRIIDSTGILELIVFIEKNFRISFDDSDLVPDNLDSIADIAAFVERKRARPVAA